MPTPDFTPGSLVGSYRLEARLDRGGRDQVWRAVHETMGQARALKIIEAPDEAGEQGLSRVRRQAELRHPHIVELIDLFRFDDCVVLVLELVDGPTLYEYLASGRAGPEGGSSDAALQLFDQVVFAVAAAHNANVVHGDISASNVLLDMRHDPPRAKLADFGGAEDEGTASYLAPERRAGLGPSKAADVFALGVLLQQLVAAPDPHTAAVITAATDPSPATRPRDGAALMALLQPSESQPGDQAPAPPAPESEPVPAPVPDALPEPGLGSELRPRPPQRWWLPFLLGAAVGAAVWALATSILRATG